MSCVVDIEVLISTLPSLQTVRSTVQDFLATSESGGCIHDSNGGGSGLDAFPSILSSWQLLLDRVVNTSSSSSSSKPPSMLFTLESQSEDTEVFVAHQSTTNITSTTSNTTTPLVLRRGPQKAATDEAHVVNGNISSSGGGGGGGGSSTTGSSTTGRSSARWERLPAHGRLIDTTVSFSVSASEEEEHKNIIEALVSSKGHSNVFSSSIPSVDRRTIELGRPALFVKESPIVVESSNLKTTKPLPPKSGIVVDVSNTTTTTTTTPSSLLHLELCYRRRFAAVLIDACLEGAVGMYGDNAIILPEVPCVALLSTMSPTKQKHGTNISNNNNGGFTDESGDEAFLPPPPPFIIVQGSQSEQHIAETLHDTGMGAFLASPEMIVKILQELSHLVTAGGRKSGLNSSSPLHSAESADDDANNMDDGDNANIPTSEALSAMSRERKRRSREGRIHTSGPGEAAGSTNDAVNLALQALPLFQNSEPLLNGSVVTNSGGNYTRSPVYVVKSEDFCSVFGGWVGVPFGQVREGVSYISMESQERVRALRSKLRFIVCVQRDDDAQRQNLNPLVNMLSGITSQSHQQQQRPYISQYLRCTDPHPSSACSSQNLNGFVVVDVESASFLRHSSKIVGGESPVLKVPPPLPISPTTSRAPQSSPLATPPPLSSYLGVLSNNLVLQNLSLPLSKKDEKGKVVKSTGPTGDATVVMGPNTLQLNVLRFLEPATILSKSSSLSFSLTPSSRVTSSTALLLAATRARSGVVSNKYMSNLLAGRKFYIAQSPSVSDAARDAMSACHSTVKEFGSSISTLWSHFRSTTSHSFSTSSAVSSPTSPSSSISVLSQISEEYRRLMQISKNMMSTSRHHCSPHQGQLSATADEWLEHTSSYIIGMGGSVVFTPSEATHVVVWDLDELMRQMDCVSKKRLPKLNPLLPPATGVDRYHHSLKRLVALVSSLTVDKADEVSTAISSKQEEQQQLTSSSSPLPSESEGGSSAAIPHHHVAFSVSKILRQLRAALKTIVGCSKLRGLSISGGGINDHADGLLTLAEQRASLLHMIQSAPGDANIVDMCWLESCASSTVQQIPPMCCWAVSEVFVKSMPTPSITFDVAEDDMDKENETSKESGDAGDQSSVVVQRHPHHVSFLKQLDEIISIYTLSSSPQPSPVVVKATHIAKTAEEEEDASPSRSSSSESWNGSGGSLGIGSRSGSMSSSSSSSSDSSSESSGSQSSSQSAKHSVQVDSSRLAETATVVDTVPPPSSPLPCTSTLFPQTPHPRRVWNLVSSQLRLLSAPHVPIELMRMAPTRFAHRNISANTNAVSSASSSGSSPVIFVVVFPLHSPKSSSQPPLPPPAASSPNSTNTVVSIVSLTTAAIAPSLNGTLPCRSVTTQVIGGGGKLEDLHMCPSSWPVNEDDCPFSCILSTSSSSKDGGSYSSSSSGGGSISIDIGRGFIGGQTIPATTSWRGYNSGLRCQFYHGLLIAAALFPPRGGGVGTTLSSSTSSSPASDYYIPACQYSGLGEARAVECAGLIQPKIRIASLIRTGKNTYEEFHRPMAMPTWKFEVGSEVAPEPLSNTAAHTEEAAKLKASTLSIVALNEVASQFGCSVSEWDAVLSAPHRTSNHQYIGGALLRREAYFTVLVTGRSAFWKDVLIFLANSSKSVAHLLNAPKPPILTKNTPLHAYNGVVAVNLAQTVMKYYRGILMDMHKSTFMDLSPKSSSWSPMPFQEAIYALSLITLWHRYEVYPSSISTTESGGNHTSSSFTGGGKSSSSSSNTMPSAAPVMQPHVDFGVYSIGHTSSLSHATTTTKVDTSSEMDALMTRQQVKNVEVDVSSPENQQYSVSCPPHRQLPHYLHCCAAETALMPEPYVSPADLCTSMLSLDRAYKAHLHHEVNAVSFILSLDETFDFSEAFSGDRNSGGVSVACDTYDLPQQHAANTTKPTVLITTTSNSPTSASMSPTPWTDDDGAIEPPPPPLKASSTSPTTTTTATSQSPMGIHTKQSTIPLSSSTFCYRKPLAASTLHNPEQLPAVPKEVPTPTSTTVEGATPQTGDTSSPSGTMQHSSTTSPLGQQPNRSKTSPSDLSGAGIISSSYSRVAVGFKRGRVSPPPLQASTSILPPPPSLPPTLPSMNTEVHSQETRYYGPPGGGSDRWPATINNSSTTELPSSQYHRRDQYNAKSVLGHFKNETNDGNNARTEQQINFNKNISQQQPHVSAPMFADGPSRSPTMDNRYPPLSSSYRPHPPPRPPTTSSHHQMPTSASTSPNNNSAHNGSIEYRPDRDYQHNNHHTRHHEEDRRHYDYDDRDDDDEDRDRRRNYGYDDRDDDIDEDRDRRRNYGYDDRDDDENRGRRRNYHSHCSSSGSSGDGYDGSGGSSRYGHNTNNNSSGYQQNNKPVEKKGFGLMKRDRYR